MISERLSVLAPLAGFALALALAAGQFASRATDPGPGTVSVRVIGPADGVAAGGDQGNGSVDLADVRPDGFTLTGWADLRAGRGLVLETTRSGIQQVLRLRTLRRDDVVGALDDPALRYSGFSISGTVAQLGAPQCLLLTGPTGTRVLWEAPGRACASPAVQTVSPQS